MSGNTFVCARRRNDQRRMEAAAATASSTVHNESLHRENEQRLADMIRLREQQDQGVYSPLPRVTTATATATSITYTKQ